MVFLYFLIVFFFDELTRFIVSPDEQQEKYFPRGF